MLSAIECAQDRHSSLITGACASDVSLICSRRPRLLTRMGALGLPLVYHLPGVGQNVRDHPNGQVRLRLKPRVPEDDIARRAVWLRDIATGSSTPNDMILSPASLSIQSSPQARIRAIRFTAVSTWRWRLARSG
jgi:hypothetical protein